MQSGCKVCVWDLYRRDLSEYNKRLAEVDPGAEPLAEVQQQQMVMASLDAFEALERRLAQQQRRQQQQQNGQQGQ